MVIGRGVVGNRALILCDVVAYMYRKEFLLGSGILRANNDVIELFVCCIGIGTVIADRHSEVGWVVPTGCQVLEYIDT
jgi:hypothetical protein